MLSLVVANVGGFFLFSFGLSSFRQCTGLDIMTFFWCFIKRAYPNMTQYHQTFVVYERVFRGFFK